MEVCTIIAKNYVAHARVLAESLVRHNPNSRLWTLIIDDFSGYIDPAAEPFEVLTPRDIRCEPFTRMALSYSVLELSTAVKPWLLRHLMATTGGAVTYLDPDIRIYGSLSRLDELARQHGLVLIPHNHEPIPSDGRKPTQVDIMLSGVFNLGYVSLAPRPEVDRLLDWWSDRLRYDCRVDHSLGFFVDQRWFDLAPGFLADLAIVREPEYNLAYWNLHSRTLSHANGSYLVDGRPLAFFHFSGFDPTEPLLLSYHQDRIDVLAHPVLERLLNEYAAEVMDHGHAVSRRWPYSYVALGDGTAVDSTLRALYDQFADEQEAKGAAGRSPFTLEGANEFKAWVREQAPGAPAGVSRALAGVYAGRADLRRAYSDLSQLDVQGLLRWAEEFGRFEVPALAWAAAPNGSEPEVTTASASSALVSAAPDQPPGMRQTPWGVNVITCGDCDTEGLSAASLVTRAMDSEGIAALQLGDDVVDRTLKVDLKDAPFPVNIICLGASSLPRLGSEFGSNLLGGRYTIGQLLWPLGTLPEELRDSLSLLEELWAPSAHVVAAVEAHAPGRLSTIALPVQPPARRSWSRASLQLPDDRFVFAFSFDYVSGFERKNPTAVIEAFRTAFPRGEDAQLVLHCVNTPRGSRDHAVLLAAAGEDPAVRVIESDGPGTDRHRLTAVCDCYVSLHRAEAFGLELAEAMWWGKPVIATAYSGNLDFMSAENSMLVDYRLIPVGTGVAPFPAEGQWADPSIEEAAELMRRVYEDPVAARRIGARAAEQITIAYSPQAVGAAMSRRLESIRAVGRPRRARERGRNLPPTLAQLPYLLVRGIDSGRRTGLRKLARRLILRLMRPYTAYQDVVNRELVTALNEVSESIEELRRNVIGEQAVLLAELRRSRQLEADSAHYADDRAEANRRT